MATTDPRLYEALLRLRGNSDFAVVIDWIEKQREECKENLTMRAVSDIQLDQGAARAFGTILKTYRDAAETLRRLNA